MPIGELYFMTRNLATNSVCPVVFEGLSGAIIPEGFIVQDVAGRGHGEQLELIISALMAR